MRERAPRRHPERTLLHLAFQLRGVTGLCNKTEQWLHDGLDPTLVVS